MSTENTPTATGGPAEKASRWADNEKIALLVAINKSMGGKIVWANVEVPAGRTTGSSQKQYEAIVKQASGVTMTGGVDITPISKKRKTADGDDVKGAKAKKPRAPRKKAEPKGAKGGKGTPAKSAAATSASDDEEELKDEDDLAIKNEEDCEDLIGNDIAALGDGREVVA